MSATNLPFFIVFLSTLLPITGAFFDISVYHMSAGLVIIFTALAYSFVSIRINLILRSVWLNWVLVILIILLIIQVLSGRGFVILATGGYVIVFSFIFLSLFFSGAGISVVKIVSGVSFLYKFLIIMMIIEAIIIFCDQQQLLTELFYSTRTPGYKNYNSADFLRSIGLMENAGGLNSLLLGSQIACMLSLFSTIWFVGIKNFNMKGSIKHYPRLWIFFSLLMLLVSINGTGLFLLVISIIIYFLLIYSKNKFFLSYIAIVVLLSSLFFLVSNGFLLSRVLNNQLVNLPNDLIQLYLNYGIYDQIKELTVFEYYMFEFFVPVDLFIKLDWVDTLIGVGANYLRTTNNYLSGDFGFGAAVLASGSLWMTAFVSTLFAICLPVLKLVAYEPNNLRLWSTLGSINGLISILWLFSTIHYNQAFSNPGGMMFFALHLALTFYCRQRYVSLCRLHQE